MDTGGEPGKSLVASVKDVASYGVMLGLGEAYIATYAIKHLDAPSPLVGVLATAPPFLGALFQVWSANLLDRRPRRRRIYLCGAVTQAVLWPVIVATIWMPREVALPVLLGAVGLYFAGVHFSSPAWNSMMGDLVPFDVRGRYFAWRNRAAIFCQLLGLALAGAGLQVFQQGGRQDLGFALIFSGAFVARAISVWYLAQMREPAYRPRPEDSFSLLDFLRALPRSNFARFALYVAAVSFSVGIAGPYFAVYMLRDLGFSYTELMIAQGMNIGAHVIQLFTWGPLCDRFGNKRVLAICGAGITLVPLLWLFSRETAYIFLLQFIAGASWSGFNLSAANFLLDAVTPAKRARCTAYFNLFNGAGIALGGLLGAFLVDRMPPELFGIALFSPLYGVMIASFGARLVTQIVFLRGFREVRDVQPISALGLFFRATHLQSVSDLAMDLLSGYLRGGKRTEDETWEESRTSNDESPPPEDEIPDA